MPTKVNEDKKNKTPVQSLSNYAANLMPKDKHAKQLLQKRAYEIAKPLTTTKRLTTEKYIHFKLANDDSYGIPYSFAKEILDKIMLTHVPCPFDFIAGVINWRGSLLTVIDLEKFFHLNERTENTKPSSYVIVINAKGITIGVLSDNLVGNDAYDAAELQSPLPSASIQKSKYILGLHRGITAILNMNEIFQDLETQLNEFNKQR